MVVSEPTWYGKERKWVYHSMHFCSIRAYIMLLCKFCIPFQQFEVELVFRLDITGLIATHKAICFILRVKVSLKKQMSVRANGLLIWRIRRIVC